MDHWERKKESRSELNQMRHWSLPRAMQIRQAVEATAANPGHHLQGLQFTAMTHLSSPVSPMLPKNPIMEQLQRVLWQRAAVSTITPHDCSSGMALRFLQTKSEKAHRREAWPLCKPTLFYVDKAAHKTSQTRHLHIFPCSERNCSAGCPLQGQLLEESVPEWSATCCVLPSCSRFLLPACVTETSALELFRATQTPLHSFQAALSQIIHVHYAPITLNTTTLCC